jgi:hypothetical protein
MFSSQSIVACVGVLFCAAAPTLGAETNSYSQMKPLLERYCFDCHADGEAKGNVSLDSWSNDEEALADMKTWERVLNVVERGEMPPAKKSSRARVKGTSSSRGWSVNRYGAIAISPIRVA